MGEKKVKVGKGSSSFGAGELDGEGKFRDSRLSGLSSKSDLSDDGKFRDGRGDVLKRKSLFPTLEDVGKRKDVLAKDTDMMGRHQIEDRSEPMWKPHNMDDMTIMGKDDTSVIKKKLKKYVHERHADGWLKSIDKKKHENEGVDIEDISKKVKKAVARYVPKRRILK